MLSGQCSPRRFAGIQCGECVSDKGELRLYVTGSTLLSERAIETIQWCLREGLGNVYACEVIDALERPDLADRDGIFATPTLVRRSPPPVRKLIGDLSDRTLVLSSLRLDAHLEDTAGERRAERG